MREGPAPGAEESMREAMPRIRGRSSIAPGRIFQLRSRR